MERQRTGALILAAVCTMTTNAIDAQPPIAEQQLRQARRFGDVYMRITNDKIISK